MTTFTCYADIGWCGEVPIEQKPTVIADPWALPSADVTPTLKPTTGTNSIARTTVLTQPQPTTARSPTAGQSTTHSSSAASSPIISSSELPTSSPTLAHASSDGGGGGVSKGAAAGIAIATALLGGAIAFLVAFMLFRRRRRPSSHRHSDSSTKLIMASKGGEASYVQVPQAGPPPVLAAAAIPTSNRNSLNLSDLSKSSDFLAGMLPAAADEQSVKTRVTALWNQVMQHVDDFYRDVHATLTPTMENDLRKFGDNTLDLLEELELSSQPTIAIKHALINYILNIVAPEADEQSTLFPVEVAGLKQDERSSNTSDDRAAYIIYRRIAALLHNPTAASVSSRQSDIREAAEHFALAFFPWANPAYADQDKDEALADVISNALDLSVWLFSQPYIYEFVWENVGRRGTVVAPGLLKCTDERGATLERPVQITSNIVLSP